MNKQQAQLVTKDELSTFTSRMQGMVQTRLSALEERVNRMHLNNETRLGALEDQTNKFEARFKIPDHNSEMGRMKALLEEVIVLRKDVNELKGKSTPSNYLSANSGAIRAEADTNNTLEVAEGFENLRSSFRLLARNLEQLTVHELENTNVRQRLTAGASIQKRLYPLEHHWQVEFDLKDGPLGVEVDGKDGKTLTVTTVHDWGVVAKWNRSGMGDAISCGDKIIQVNQIGDSSKLMLSEITANKKLRFTVCKASDKFQTHV